MGTVEFAPPMQCLAAAPMVSADLQANDSTYNSVGKYTRARDPPGVVSCIWPRELMLVFWGIQPNPIQPLRPVRPDGHPRCSQGLAIASMISRIIPHCASSQSRGPYVSFQISLLEHQGLLRYYRVFEAVSFHNAALLNVLNSHVNSNLACCIASCNHSDSEEAHF